MAISLAGNLVPKGGNTFYLLEDIYVKGGISIWPTVEALNAGNPLNWKAGALAIILEPKGLYEYMDNVWRPVQLAPAGDVAVPARAVIQHVTEPLKLFQVVDVDLELGKNALIFGVALDRPAKVQFFSTPQRNDPNPYTFIAARDHLKDDGTSFISDGTVEKRDHLFYFSNNEPTPTNKAYVRIINTDEPPALYGVVYPETPCVLSIGYLKLL